MSSAIKNFFIHPALFKLDGGAMFGIIPKPMWEKKIKADEFNRIQLSLRVMGIESKNKKVLIDCGIGDYHPEKFNQQFDIHGEKNPLVSILKKYKLWDAKDVTDVILTHLHFDHVGGIVSTDDLEEIFPNATYHLHQKHWDYALNPTQRDTGSFQKQFFQPLLLKAQKENRLKTYHEVQGELIPEIDLNYKISMGHTPYLLHPYGPSFIYMADLVPTSHHLSIPWVMGYDINPGQTTKDKEEFYQFIHEKNLIMIFEHDVDFWGAKINWQDSKLQVQSLFESFQEPFQELHLDRPL